METSDVKSRATKTAFIFNSYYRVHPEDRQKFVDAVAEHIPPTAQMPGCVYYVFAADILDPNTFHLSEGWEDADTIERHHRSDLFQEALKKATTSVRILENQGQRYEIAAQTDGRPPRLS
ncbi:MAG: hypothetical protein AVDCRST_MAG83-1198 [uncultured Arthrobacter sp.]|uniref:ABM domain-containing protein n=1 Tax=uncultured Arthrobacter sp. TaxID=114050 RepID=A0A6J4HT57_9MICC|nr:MAG: hypothetical protein AVDCRST_MAG83-1198 [uncultured Arthrobacter sp.]